MNHGWPNLGHDSLVHAVLDTACDLLRRSRATGPRVRVALLRRAARRCSRRRRAAASRSTSAPAGPGTSRPAPQRRRSPGARGSLEDPAWEAPLFELFDRIRARPRSAALLAVCHTFGVMCRWSGVAQARAARRREGRQEHGRPGERADARGPRASLVRALRRGAARRRRLRVVDNRLFDLIPVAAARAGRARPIGYETPAWAARAARPSR